MTKTAPAAEGQPNGNRAGSSRKLLTRKARETASAEMLTAGGLEANFPLREDSLNPPGKKSEPLRESSPKPDADAAPAGAPAADGTSEADHTARLPQRGAPAPAAAVTWSSEDEAALQILLARRKAAGFQRRGKDVGSQVLRPSSVKPNAETIIGIIVGLVAGRGTVTRSELIELMQAATFPHPKAQPGDKGWCQGYVAGAVRNGFLVVENAAAPAEEA